GERVGSVGRSGGLGEEEESQEAWDHLLRPSRCSPYALGRRHRVVRLIPRCLAVSASFHPCASNVLTIASFSRAANVGGPAPPGTNLVSPNSMDPIRRVLTPPPSAARRGCRSG